MYMAKNTARSCTGYGQHHDSGIHRVYRGLCRQRYGDHGTADSDGRTDSSENVDDDTADRHGDG